MEKVLLEKQEIDTIKDIQQSELDLVSKIGQVEYQIQSLILQKKELREEINKLQIKSSKFGSDLQQKYGDGNVNIETGEFTKIS